MLDDVSFAVKHYAACLKLGGKNNGTPGAGPRYHPNFYGGFVVAPNGWRIEACFYHYQP